MSETRTFEIYRYDPDKDAPPHSQVFKLEVTVNDRMLLDVLIRLKAQDETLSFRRSCREGVCGSDAMNINGKNGLACTTNLNDLPRHTVLRPLPGLPVVRDLIVDMTAFFKQYDSIMPYLINDTPPPSESGSSRRRNVINSTVSMNASCARVARARALHTGGTRINTSVQQGCYRLIAFWSIPATKELPHGWIISMTRTVCSDVARF